MIEPLWLQNELDADQADRDRLIEARRRYRPRPTGTREDKPMLDTGKQHGPHDWERYQWRWECNEWRTDVGDYLCRVRKNYEWEPTMFAYRFHRHDDPDPDFGLFWTPVYWEPKWSFYWNLHNARGWVIFKAEQESNGGQVRFSTV